MNKKLLINNQEIDVKIIKQTNGHVEFELEGKTFRFDRQAEHLITSKLDNNSTNRHQVFSKKFGEKTFLAIQSRSFIVEDAAVLARGGGALHGAMVSPMPGKILKIMKKVGDSIAQGESILVMEAMKMEHTIKASSDGVISKLNVSEGQQVDGGLILVELEEIK